MINMIVPEQTLEVWQVSLRPSRVGEVPEGTARIARAVFPNGCLAMRMRDVLGAVFTDDEFAAVFPSRGRPAISPALLAFVSVLQFGEGLTDRQAAHAVRAARGPLRSGGGPSYASLAENLLNAALADLELFGQLPRSRPSAVARDNAMYVRLGQPIADPPDAWSLLRADATASIGRPAIVDL